MKPKKKTMKAKPQQSRESSILDRIKPVKEMAVRLKILAYGRSGSGKTHLAGTAPPPVLLLDIREEGYTTVRNRPGIFVLPVHQWDDIEEVYWYLKSGEHPYKTVVIDTLTSLQDLAMKDVLGENFEGRITRQTWGDIAGKMKTWIMNFRDLEMNVIFTAQDRLSGGASEEEYDVDLDGQLMPEMGPFVMPSVSKVLNACVGVIGNTFIREVTKKVKTAGGDTKTKTEVRFSMRVGPHARYTTKIREDTEGSDLFVPSLIDDPTFDKIYKISLGGTEE